MYFQEKTEKPLHMKGENGILTISKRICGEKEWVKAHSLLLHRHKTEGNEVLDMAKGSMTEKKILPLLEPIVEEKGLDLVEVEFVKEGANWYLRVFIDKDGGVTIEDCEGVSRLLEAKLDETDPIEQAYILEVSSPGIDRPLKKDKDFEKYQGEIIDVKLYQAVDGTKQFQGKLLGLEDGVISLEEEDGTVRKFVKKETASVKLAVIF